MLMGSANAKRPDVLMLVVDDMNDWISLLDERSPIKTPNLERLADRGVSFTRAYCASAACNPSRVSALTGLRPSSSGVYGNASDWRKALPDRMTIMQQFKRAGYEVNGAGKIFHHHLDGAFHDKASFDSFQPMAPQNMPPEKLNRGKEYGSRNTDWGAWPGKEKDTIDYRTADYCIEQLKRRDRERPLFLACGIFKPHSPFFAPPKYHEGVEGIPMPKRLEDDWDDLPEGAQALMKKKKWFWQGMTNLEEKHPGSYRRFIEAYAACCAFADAQIGRVLDALDESGRSDNTIICLWSDHGFHLGEKDHIEKFALWEKSNRIPYLFAVPDVTPKGVKCTIPVDLSSLYPTLLELAGIKTEDQMDGQSLLPLLENPSASWSQPALMTYGRGNHAIRDSRWRYIRYQDGSEELYDHQADPNEWTNLAGQAEHRERMNELKSWLPKTEKSEVGNLKKKKHE